MKREIAPRDMTDEKVIILSFMSIGTFVAEKITFFMKESGKVSFFHGKWAKVIFSTKK